MAIPSPSEALTRASPTAGLENQGDKAPRGVPMATPQQKVGEQMGAQASVHFAMELMEKALFNLPDDERAKVREALSGLRKKFPSSDTASRLVPAEIQQALITMRGPTLAGEQK